MDLLEQINMVMFTTCRVKEAHQHISHGSGCECGHEEYLNKAVMVFRRESEQPEATVLVETDGMRAGCILALDLLAADLMTLTFDGKNKVTGRKELVVVAGDRNGELLWKVQPYDTAGAMICWGEPEVPSELPIFSDRAHHQATVEADLRRMLKEKPSTVPFLDAMPPEIAQRGPEAVRAMLDLMVAGAVPFTAAGHLIDQTQLFAEATSVRAQILIEYGHMLPGSVMLG